MSLLKLFAATAIVAAFVIVCDFRLNEDGSSVTISYNPPPVMIRGHSSSASGITAEESLEEEEEELRTNSKTVQILKVSDFPDRPVSPFEERFKRSHGGAFKPLPPWASKRFFFWKDEVPDGKSVCLVHVGKAGGSTVQCALGFRLHCDGEMRFPSGLLPHYTTHLFHANIDNCWDDMGYYLFTVRNPIERMKSWFAYEKPGGASEAAWMRDRQSLYVDCPFPTLNDLAERGLDFTVHDVSDECHFRAHRAVRGIERIGNHAYYNYRYYLEAIKDSANITAIRQEHMVEDWNSMEQLLGGSDNAVRAFPRKNFHDRDPKDDYLSEKAQMLLCHALCDDIQAYKTILQRAINLSPSDVEDTMADLRKSCPIEADLTVCTK